MDSVVTLDAGSSSVRTLLFSPDGCPIQGFGENIDYHPGNTLDGSWEIAASEIVEMAVRALTAVCRQLRTWQIKPHAVAVDTFWHSLIGVNKQGEPTTAVLHPFDSRSSETAKRLAKRVDNLSQHSRTGCMLHPSYPPSKLLWLSETQPVAFRATERWMSVGEYLFLEFFGTPAASTSMISAGGLWDQNRATFDEELFAALPVKREQFADPATLDQPCANLRSPYREKWPELDGIPWFPALGDGACDSIGSGCTTSGEWALMVGTSGALRVTMEADQIEIPPGLFCYRVDRRRFVAGGALSSGGGVYAWMKRMLRLPEEAQLDKALAALTPGLHGLTILPLFEGERSPNWGLDRSGTIAGLTSGTTPVEILHAALTSVALRFRSVYDTMQLAFGKPAKLIGSGGALVHSPVWTQIMADALGTSMTMCLEGEATSRGAALLAFERLGLVRNIADAKPKFGASISPDPAKHSMYNEALAKQRLLYRQVFEETQST